MSPLSVLPLPRPALRRGPMPIPLGFFALALAGHSLGAVQNLLIGFGGGALTAAQLRDVVAWGLMSALGYGLALAGNPLWSWLRSRGFDAPSWRNWLLFCGLFLMTGLIGGITRSALALAWFPALFREKSAVGFALNIGLINLFTALTLQMVGLYYTRLVEHNRARRRLAEELAASRTAMVAADDQLRRELAELLHGKVQSHLVAAWATLGQARARRSEPEAAAPLLELATGCVEGVRKEAMRQIRDLLAPAQASVLTLLHEQVERFRTIMPVTWTVDAAYMAHAPAVPARTAFLAARLLEEALLNAFRHARARGVHVSVRPDAQGQLMIQVQDDGIGFRPEAAPRGLGWSGLGAGLEELGGTLTLRSAPGQGTTVTIRVPTLPTARAEAA